VKLAKWGRLEKMLYGVVGGRDGVQITRLPSREAIRKTEIPG